MAAPSELDLMAFLAQIIKAAGVAGEDASVSAGEVVGQHLVRVRVLSRGGPSFLMGAGGGVLEYVRPAMSDADAVAAFAGGLRSELPAGLLAAIGFPGGRAGWSRIETAADTAAADQALVEESRVWFEDLVANDRFSTDPDLGRKQEGPVGEPLP